MSCCRRPAGCPPCLCPNNTGAVSTMACPRHSWSGTITISTAANVNACNGIVPSWYYTEY